jgi:hypothetical protein
LRKNLFNQVNLLSLELVKTISLKSIGEYYTINLPESSTPEDIPVQHISMH